MKDTADDQLSHQGAFLGQDNSNPRYYKIAYPRVLPYVMEGLGAMTYYGSDDEESDAKW